MLVPCTLSSASQFSRSADEECLHLALMGLPGFSPLLLQPFSGDKWQVCCRQGRAL